MAQQMPQMPPLPMDPAVRYGQLPNGLTYYIRHNDLPEQHAEFFIAQRVGSVLEEDNQRGLAHFLEHMAFNGTKNFPGKAMLDYLQRHGVKFGTNVNAYTSIDETVYNISDVPTDPTQHPGIVDSCLLMLHDWSGYIALEDDEIESERGVIHEEWRSRNSAMLRMYDVILPKLLPNNRYNDRMPIGKTLGENHLGVVDDFKPNELRDYYKAWYRPDLQGIFIVGDVDVDAVEQKINELWSDIHVPENAPERVYFPVEDNDEPLVAVASDPEQAQNVMLVCYKSDKMPDEMHLTQMGYIQDVIENIISSALNQRLQELVLKADAPYLGAGAEFGNYLLAKTKDAFEVDVVFQDNQWKKGLEAAMGVVLSAVQYGFTDAEIERVKAEFLSQMENAYNERDKRKNRQLVSEIQRHYLQAEPMPGIELEYQMVQQMLPMFSAAMINQVAQQLVTPNNVALCVLGQQKEGNVLPTEAELLEAYKAALQQEVKPYEEKLSGIKLLPAPPTQKTKIAKTEDGIFGSKVWTLDNGIKVVWKQTDYKKDQVLFEAFSQGGTRTDLSQPKVVRELMENIYSHGGIGEFSTTDLPKVLAGKRASVGVNIGTNSEYLQGSAAPKDIRSLFEQVYLYFTAPRYDEEAATALMNQLESQFKMLEGNPDKIMSDSLTMTLYAGQKDMVPLQLADLKDVNFKRDFEVAKKRFANAADFTFYFVGNVDEDSLRVMCEEYLGGLPVSAAREQRPAEVMPTRGSRQNRFDLPMQQAKTSVYNFFYLFDQKYNLKDAIMTNMVGQITSIVFTETIREREGGVYSPGAQAGFSQLTGTQTMIYLFDTGADKLEHIEKVAFDEFKKMADEGVPADAFQKVHDYLAKQHEEQLKENSYWRDQIQTYDLYGINNVDGWQEALDSITLEDVQNLIRRFVTEADRVQFVANGVEVK